VKVLCLSCDVGVAPCNAVRESARKSKGRDGRTYPREVIATAGREEVTYGVETYRYD
jgi:hypothetical protein